MRSPTRPHARSTRNFGRHPVTHRAIDFTHLLGDVVKALSADDLQPLCSGELRGEETGQHPGNVVGIARVGQVLEVEDRHRMRPTSSGPRARRFQNECTESEDTDQDGRRG
jgi:hypothetical protein